MGFQGSIVVDGIIEVRGQDAVCQVRAQVLVEIAGALAAQFQLFLVVHPCRSHLVVEVVDALDGVLRRAYPYLCGWGR